MKRQDVIPVPAGVPKALEAGSLYQAVIVDNNSNLDVYLPGVNRYIAPGSQGVVVPLSGTQVANVLWQPRPGTVANPVPSGQAVLTFCTDELPASTGAQGFAAIAPQQLLGTFTAAANTSTLGGPFTLPTGTQSVMVTWSRTSGSGAPTFVSVAADPSSNLVYGAVGFPITETLSLNEDVFIAPVSTLVAPVIYVNITEPAGTTHLVTVLALPYPAAVTATISGVSQGIPGAPPTTKNYIVNASLGAGASTTLASAGTLFTGIYSGFVSGNAPVATAIFNLTDASGLVTYHTSYFSSIAFTHVPGCGIGAGDGGLKVTNVGNAAIVFAGSISAA